MVTWVPPGGIGLMVVVVASSSWREWGSSGGGGVFSQTRGGRPTSRRTTGTPGNGRELHPLLLLTLVTKPHSNYVLFQLKLISYGGYLFT